MRFELHQSQTDSKDLKINSSISPSFFSIFVSFMSKAHLIRMNGTAQATRCCCIHLKLEELNVCGQMRERTNIRIDHEMSSGHVIDSQ